MPLQERPFRIFMADDDIEDVELTQEALSENNFSIEISHAEDGEILMNVLTSLPPPPEVEGYPDLILLDLNMPRKNGMQVLREIKRIPALSRIPVVVFTTSNSKEDITQAYDLGASSYI